MDCHIPLSYAEVSLYILPLQELVKSSDDDCAVEWATLRTVPDGGMNDEVLTWETTSSGAGTYGWAGP